MYHPLSPRGGYESELPKATQTYGFGKLNVQVKLARKR